MLELPNMRFNQNSGLNIMSSKYNSKNRIQGFKRWTTGVCVDEGPYLNKYVAKCKKNYTDQISLTKYHPEKSAKIF